MAAPEVTLCCQKLREALSVIMEPASSPERRTEALRFCQEFRETSLLYLPCGLALAEVTEAPVVRHFGLQLLGHVVEVRWDALRWDDRLQLKQRALEQIAGAKTFDKTYVGDAAACLMVEVIKKDWPLLWPNMLSELKDLTRRGASQTRLVLLILLRLAEDVVTSDQLPSQPGRALRISLRQNMNSIYNLVENSLLGYWYKYKHLNPGQSQDQACSCVIVTALNVLVGYMEWVPIHYLTPEIYELLKTVWQFLEDPKLQLEACECLLVALDRLSSSKDTDSLLVYFTSIPLQYLNPMIMADGEDLTDRRYFLQRGQCRLVCVLIEEYCGMMDSKANMNIPSYLGIYLDILMYFTTHCSLFLNSLTQSPWRHLFEQPILSQTSLVRAMLPKYLHATRMNLVKVGFPSKYNSPRCEYSRLEFGGDEDFSDFLTTFRHEQRIVIAAAFGLDHEVCYQIVFEYLKLQLSTSFDPGPMNSVTADTLYYASSQCFVQWEAVTFFVNVSIVNMFKILNKENMPVDDCLELLQLLTNFKTEDPLILACVQTNISTLIPFLNYKKECSSQVLSKFFDMIGEIKAPKAQSLKSVRRSECSSFIQMCRENAQYLLLDVGMLNKQVSQLLCSNTLMQMEKGTVMEAMVIIINQFKNFERQKALLEELMAPIASVWQSKDIQLAISRPSHFMQYVSANIFITDTVMESSLDLNCSTIMDCVSSILGVLRWSRWPSDLEEAKTGGFVVGYMNSGRPIYRNPCTELVQKLLDNIISLLKSQHGLYAPRNVSQHSDSLAKALAPLEMENASTLDFSQPLRNIFDPPDYKTATERMQAFFSTLYEACFSVMGHAVSTVNEDLDTMMDSANRLFDSIAAIQKRFPVHRLRTMVYAFLRPMVHFCPPEYYESFLCPIIKRALDIFHTRLSDEWKIINQRNISSNDSTAMESPAVENPTSEKTLDIQVKLLTHEFVEFLFACCVPAEDASVTTASSDACCKDADASVVSGITHDGCCVSEEADDAVCTAVCDDDICVCNEEVEAAVVAAVSVDDFCVPIENDDPSPVQSEDLDESEMAAEVPLFVPRPASPEVSEVLIFVPQPASPEVSDMPLELSELPLTVPPPASTEVSELPLSVPRPAPPEISDVPLFVPRLASSEISKLPLLSPQPATLKLSELDEITEPAELTTLGVCILKEKCLSPSLLLTAFSSLVWIDSQTCNKIASRLCWPLLKQVILEPLVPENMRRLLLMVLRAIPKHKDDPFTRDALENLLFHLCESLRPLHKPFSQVLPLLKPNELFYFEKFNVKHFLVEIQNLANATKDDVKCLIEDCCMKPLVKVCQNDGRRPPAPSFLKRLNPPITDKEADNCPPPAKKLSPQTGYLPVMFVNDDFFF